MFDYHIIKREAIIPNQGKNVGYVYIIQDRVSKAEVATCLTLEDANNKLNKFQGIK